MQVITLNSENFDAHAARLSKMVEEASSERFDAIVGVRRGGSIVCDAFCRHFPASRYAARYDLSLQRPSTRHKDGRVASLLKRLPYPLLDALRMAESIMLSISKKSKKTVSAPDIDIPDGLACALSGNAIPVILVIDDAIDSGDTLRCIVEALKRINPECSISIAVFTETTRNPRIRANYSLYRNRTLIRFPWSNDYKKK